MCIYYLIYLTLHRPFFFNVRQCSLSIKRYVYSCHTGQAGFILNWVNVRNSGSVVKFFGLWIKKLWVRIRLKQYYFNLPVYSLHKREIMLFFQMCWQCYSCNHLLFRSEWNTRHVEVLLVVTQCKLYASEHSSVIHFHDNKNIEHVLRL